MRRTGLSVANTRFRRPIPIGLVLLFGGTAYGSKAFLTEYRLYGARFPSQPFPWSDVRYFATVVPSLTRLLIVPGLIVIIIGTVWSTIRRILLKT